MVCRCGYEFCYKCGGIFKFWIFIIFFSNNQLNIELASASFLIETKSKFNFANNFNFLKFNSQF